MELSKDGTLKDKHPPFYFPSLAVPALICCGIYYCFKPRLTRKLLIGLLCGFSVFLFPLIVLIPVVWKKCSPSVVWVYNVLVFNVMIAIPIFIFQNFGNGLHVPRKESLGDFKTVTLFSIILFIFQLSTSLSRVSTDMSKELVAEFKWNTWNVWALPIVFNWLGSFFVFLFSHYSLRALFTHRFEVWSNGKKIGYLVKGDNGEWNEKFSKINKNSREELVNQSVIIEKP